MSPTVTGPATIAVLVADDQAIVRDGLVTVLSLLPDVQVVGEASNGREAVELARQHRPDVILMDLRMPVLGGAEATAMILAEQPAIAVLVLTTYADDASIVGALRAGARGYLTKDAGRVELAAALRSVASGQFTLDPAVSALLLGGLDSSHRGDAAAPATIRGRFPALTPREADTLELIGEGLSNVEIAERSFVSVATVKTHINSIFAKLQLRDRAQAIALVRSDPGHPAR